MKATFVEKKTNLFAVYRNTVPFTGADGLGTPVRPLAPGATFGWVKILCAYFFWGWLVWFAAQVLGKFSLRISGWSIQRSILYYVLMYKYFCAHCPPLPVNASWDEVEWLATGKTIKPTRSVRSWSPLPHQPVRLWCNIGTWKGFFGDAHGEVFLASAHRSQTFGVRDTNDDSKYAHNYQPK